jgi:HAE1 family hydrophobic/amphiphilic exporter-1
MKISSFTVRHPILTTMIALIVVILGFVALRRLPVDLMPDISFPVLSINTSYPNSSPPIVEQLISRPIEEAMAAVPGVEEITSVSSEGSSNVQLSFAWGTNLDAAAADVRDRLDRVTGRLPEDAERPRLFKFDPSNIPIMTLGAFAEADPVYLRELIDEQVAYRLERVDGVASVDVFGGVQREIQVDLLPDRLQLLGLSVDQVIRRIQAANVETPLGSVTQGNYERTLRSSALYQDLDELRDTVVAVRDGTPIPLAQVARVSDGSVKLTRIARINGRSGIRLSVSKQSGRNTVEVARQVRRELDRIRADFPQLELVVLNDNSRYIASALRNVGTSALYGALIAVGVLLFFLRNVPSTLVISISIPFSIIATFVLMYANGFTLNIMSLGGLAMGVGMMVDNSIVVLENSFRLRQTGLSASEAAVQGAGEVTYAVIASTLTTIVVFLPLIFIRGISGVMYKQLALVVSFSLICSLVSSLTLVPMMSARLLRYAGAGASEPALARSLGRALGRLERGYGGLLSRALSRPLATVAVIVLATGASLLLVPLIGSEVMPSTDEGQVRISGELETGTRLELTDKAFQDLEARAREAVPELQTMITSVGGGFRSSGSSAGQINLNLVPRRERGRSDAQIADGLRRRLAGTPGLTLRVRTSQGFFLMRGGSSNTERIQIEVRGYDLAAGRELVGRIRELVQDAPGVTDVQLSQEADTLEDLVVVDRRRVAEFNLTVEQVTALLRTLIAGSQAGTFREADTEVPIVVRLAGREAFDLERLLALPVVNGEGRAVPLANVVSLRRQPGPMAIERKDQERLLTVYVNTSGRDVGSIVADMRSRLRALPLPPGFTVLFTGEWEQQRENFRELGISILLSLLLIYMVMAGLYESLRDPFVVMFSIPLASIGVLVMLFFTRTTFNIQTWIGVLMLGGIVVNNAILLVDTANLLRRRDGMALREAILAACGRRLRPVLMTALTTMVALLPLALGLGEGGEVQAPLARTVIGGLASSTLITLVFIPCLYLLFERRKEKQRRQAEAAG